MNKLPLKLMKLRKHYNYSQSYLAEVLGVETLEYMNYENGSDMISYDQMKKLASLYNIDLVEMFRNSDEVTLYDTGKANTDEINIDFFTRKQTPLDKIRDIYQRNKTASIIIAFLLLTILVLTMVLKNSAKPYELERDNINRLSASKTTVVYIDDYSGVNGSGSNTNGELSNLTSSGAIKVCEGEGFTIILNDDGTLSSAGLIAKYASAIADWRNIVDIAAGSSHILGVDSNGRVKCVGDDSGGACDIVDVRNVKKVYATANGSIVMDASGSLSFAGTFIGSGSLKNYSNIKDIASSDSILAILAQDQTIDVFTRNSINYLQAESWEDIVDVACGDSFVAGLDSYGKVHIEIDNDEIEEQVAKWSNIIAIAASSDYLIGFDGVKIYGVGNNNYGQFVKEDLVKQRLEKVSNVEYRIDDRHVNVQFDGVSNASGYIVAIDVGIGISRRIETAEPVQFETENMTEGKIYTISIISVGEGDYTDSDPYKVSFTYNKPEPVYSFPEGANQPEDKFIEYLISLGVDPANITGKPGGDDDICAGDVVTVSYSNLEGRLWTRSDLLKAKIEYTYCKVVADGEE